MKQLPDRITRAWIDTLDNSALLLAESRLHKTFATMEKEQKKLRGSQYDLMRGPEDLLAAWDRWSRVSSETRNRGLQLRRTAKKTV